MNKWQIICPLAAMGLVAIALGFRHAGSHTREDLFAAASLVGDDIARSTNSERITDDGPALKSNLLQFLAVPAKCGGVRPETPDEGKPTAVVSLVNEAGDRFDLHLRWEAKLRKFALMGYSYPAIWPPTNWPQSNK